MESLGYFRLVLRSLDDAEALGFLNNLRTELLRLGVVAELLARLRTSMTGERLTRKRSAAVPAFRNGIACNLRDDDVRGGLCGCRSRLFATLAIFGERLARKHDGLWRWAVGLNGLVVGGTVVYAVERGLRGKSTRNTRALIAVATTATTIASVV